MSNDPVKHPSHYTQGGIECIEAIKASMTREEYVGYLKGNAMKYLWRYRNKANPKEDLLKAQTYLGWLVEEISKDTTTGITIKDAIPISGSTQIEYQQARAYNEEIKEMVGNLNA